LKQSTSKLLFSSFIALFLSACDQTVEQELAQVEVESNSHPEAHQYGNELGSIEFPVSCNELATPMMERGVALLHHMTYTGAGAEFSRAIEADPACALAYWGVAMSYVHPLWNDAPSEERLTKGLELLNKAADLSKTDREAGFISAALAYFDGATDRRESESLVLSRDAWEKVYRDNPDDIEAASFFALSLMGAADKSDKAQTDNARAGMIVENVLEQVPDHPAGHHYTIHAYDSPDFADQALLIARKYSDVAPEVPHALHMPTHIFTRLGYWNDSIAMNIRSARAAETSTGGEYTSSQMLHAQDYLVYAHLQKANEEAAREVMEYASQLQGPWDQNARGAAAYSFAAMPARFALERRDWAAAAELEARQPESFPWSDGFAAFEAIAWFGRGLGAAIDGQPEVASAAIVELTRLKDILSKNGDDYWATQLDIQLNSVTAWNAYTQGYTETALASMKHAAELENSTFKHPITPGEILPANELYGDMLLETGQAEAALVAYRYSMDRSPGRFNSLYGAAIAADSLGDTEAAANYFASIVKMTAGSDVDWPRLKSAREYLSGEGEPST
jgi:hypothetical protein